MSTRFISLAEFWPTDDKCIVISAMNNEKVTIGQKVVFENNGKTQEVFLKNAIVLDEKGIDTMIHALEKAKLSLSKIREVTQHVQDARG